MSRFVAYVGALLVAAALCLAAPGAARAQEDAQTKQARAFFAAGAQAYEAGQYLVAATAFEEAYRLAPRPTVAFSMAQAYRRQYFVDRDPAKLKRALDLYKQYIVDVPSGGRRDDAVQQIAELEPIMMRVEEEQKKAGKGPVAAMQPPEKRITQIMISSRTPGAKASLDGGPPEEMPLIKEVKAGPHKARVQAPGHFPEDVELTAVDGRFVPLEVNLKEMPAKLEVRAPAGAEVSVDGRPSGTLPLARPLELPAGRHFVAVSKRGHHPYTREVVVQRGETLTVTAKLDKTTQRKTSYVVFLAAGAALVAGGTTTGLALVHQGNAEDIRTAQSTGNITQAQLDEYERERGKRDDYASASVYLYSGAAVLFTTGVLLYFIDSPRVQAPPLRDEGPSEPAVTPTVGPDGMMGATWVTRF